MKVRITIDIYPELSDPGHETGVTNDGYVAIYTALSNVGSDIDIEAVQDA